MAIAWNPDQYNRFADDRGRPFFDLLARVRADDPRRVIDLGCGPGNLTAELARRWPGAVVHGIDSSPDMIAAATGAEIIYAGGARPTFGLGDINAYRPGSDVDVLISNAALQWVPEHRDLLLRWSEKLPAGAWMAWQVPGNFDADSHRLLFELATSRQWAPRLSRMPRPGRLVMQPDEYGALLLDAGWAADVWETTYHHVLQGQDAVLEWVRGTTLGPIKALLTPTEFTEFEGAYAGMLREAYPARTWGTLYPFRRIFAVGHRD